jgi:hypothetical protein
MMKAVVLVLLAVTATGTQVTPVEKVIQMLNGMVAKGKNDKQAEQTQFAAYKQFCDDTNTKLKHTLCLNVLMYVCMPHCISLASGIYISYIIIVFPDIIYSIFPIIIYPPGCPIP